MSSAATLPLSIPVNVVVSISPQGPAVPTFNQGLIIGNSGRIPSSSRLRKYASLAAMAQDGFLTTDPEYIAASLYFAQVPQALFLWVGCQDPSGIAALNVHSGNAGINYKVNDIVTIAQSGASLGTAQVTSINVGTGAVTGLQLLTAGTGYAVANTLVATGGSGTGLEVDISAIGEPPLQAAMACRAASSAWYGFMCTTTGDADDIALAAWAQTANPSVVYFASTNDAAVLNNTGGNIAFQMKALGYNRVVLMYNTTQTALFPNNVYAAAAILGVIGGLNTGLARSAYTLKFKILIGVASEPLTLAQVTVLQNLNVNTYLSYGGAYTWMEQGVMANGEFFDNIIGRDMLIANIQFGVLNLLTGSPKVPLTDPGQTQLLHAVNQACDVASEVGYIGGGVWEGVQILKLQPGQALPKGYLAQSDTFANQLPTDRIARKAMPIFVALIQAEAVHSLVVQLNIQP